MRRLVPDTIAGRTLLVLLLGLTVSHALSVALYFTDRASALALAGEEHVGERIVTVLRLIENAPKAERIRLVQLADNPELRVTWSAESALSDQRESNWQSANCLMTTALASRDPNRNCVRRRWKRIASGRRRLLKRVRRG